MIENSSNNSSSLSLRLDSEGSIISRTSIILFSTLNLVNTEGSCAKYPILLIALLYIGISVIFKESKVIMPDRGLIIPVII